MPKPNWLALDLRQRARERFSRNRMSQVWCDFYQRLQHKPSLEHGRMRNYELRRVNRGLAKKQNVDIDKPRPFEDRRRPSLAAHLALYALSEAKEL